MLYLLYSLLEVLMCVKVLKALRSPAVFTTVFYKVIFVISMTILWNSCYMEHILRNPGLEDKSQKLLKAENEALHSSPPGYLSKFIFLSVISPLWAILHSQNLQYPHFAFPGKSSLSPSLSCKLLLKLQNSTQPPILQSLNFIVLVFLCPSAVLALLVLELLICLFHQKHWWREALSWFFHYLSSLDSSLHLFHKQWVFICRRGAFGDQIIKS